MRELWSTELPYAVLGSSTPVYDPLTDSLLVSDGWGTPYGALSLRRMTLSSGALDARLVVRGAVYSVALSQDGDSALAAVGNRLVELDRGSLQERRRWDSRVPRYSQFSAFVQRSALLMNWARPSLTLYDLEGGRGKRWTLGSCNGMFVRSGGDIIVCSGYEGLVSVCNVDDRSLVLTPRPQFVLSAYAPAADLLVLGLGRPSDVIPNGLSRQRLCDRLLLIGSASPSEVSAPVAFDTLWVSPDGTHLYLGREDSLAVCRLRGGSCELETTNIFPENHVPFVVVSERSLVVTADRRLQPGRISAWAL